MELNDHEADSENDLNDANYDLKCEFLHQYAQIISREGNVPVCVLRVLSRLNHWFHDIIAPRLQYYYGVYCKYAPRLAKAEHRRLISHPIEYTNNIIRTIPVINLLGHGGGMCILNSDPPLFSNEFLADRRPALVNICALTNRPVPFFYKIGLRSGGILRSGFVDKCDYVVLPPYTESEVNRVREQGHDVPVEIMMPGRYFVDLNLELDINPVLFSEGLFHIDDILFIANYHLMWHDAGGHLEPSLTPNIRTIIDNFTHIIARFVTTPTALIDNERYVICMRDARKFSTIKERGVNVDVANVADDIDFVGIHAEDLLG